MPSTLLQRRRSILLSLAAPALGSCAIPLPDVAAQTLADDAHALLQVCAAAHGLTAFSTIGDLSVRYEGQWAPLVSRLQPALVDRGFRSGSEERLLTRAGLVAQAHSGPDGLKQVVRRPVPGRQGDVTVWFNGEQAEDAERRAAAALVADFYAVFLLGPMALVSGWGMPRRLTGSLDHPEQITVDGRAWVCDVLQLRAAPGFGFSDAERLALFIDREERLMRRVRFSLNGLASTRGAVAEVDVSRHLTLHGVRWPTWFHERLLRPLPIPLHDWRLKGLDVNRGIEASEIAGAAFHGRAIQPASPIAS